MAIGIYQEALNRITSFSDCDSYRYIYTDYEYQKDGSRVDISFVSPVFKTWEKYRFCLLADSTTKTMHHKYKYRPDYLSFDEYGTTDWWQLIMWINNVKSIEYFNMDDVLIPSKDAINKIEDEYGKDFKIIDLNADKQPSKNDCVLYSDRSTSIDQAEYATTTGVVESKTLVELLTDEKSEETQFCRECFTLTIPILRLKYVDLKNEPVENSVRVICTSRPNITYKKHYILTGGEDPNVVNRISWNPANVKNAGLVFNLRENDILEVEYVKKQ